MADVFAEVDEAMRQERVQKLWQEYGSVLITFLVCLVLGTAAISGYKAWNAGVKEKQTNLVLNYIEPGQADPAAFATASEDMRPGLRGLSLLIAAGQALDDGQEDTALSIYQKAATDKSIPVSLQDLAQLMQVRLIAKQESPSQTPEQLLGDLEKVWSNKKSPWSAHAHLEAALLEAHMNNDYAAAQEHLAVISTTDNIPQSVQNRAQSLNHVYALRQEEAGK